MPPKTGIPSNETKNGETPQEKKEHLSDLLDEALDESFPASDPVAIIEPAPDVEEDSKDQGPDPE